MRKSCPMPNRIQWGLTDGLIEKWRNISLVGDQYPVKRILLV
ncbi:hypothetical protein [Fodinibius sp. AD559]